MIWYPCKTCWGVCATSNGSGLVWDACLWFSSLPFYFVNYSFLCTFRAVCGIRNKTLILNLPGSVKGASVSKILVSMLQFVPTVQCIVCSLKLGSFCWKYEKHHPLLQCIWFLNFFVYQWNHHQKSVFPHFRMGKFSLRFFDGSLWNLVYVFI